MRAQLETITPDRASDLLRSQARNRTPRKSQVARFADDMTHGRWKLNGSTIGLSRQGALVDGQHRLLACVQAKTPFQTLVVYGLEDAAVETIDTGKARTFGDVLAFKGETRYRHEKASTVRHIMAYKTGATLAAASKYSNAAISEFARDLDWSRLCEAVDAAAPAKEVIAAAPLAAVFMLTKRAGLDVSFAEGLRTGAGLSIGSPVLTLRNWITSRRAQSKSISQDERFSALISVWNAYAEGRELTRIHVKNRGEIV